MAENFCRILWVLRKRQGNLKLLIMVSKSLIILLGTYGRCSPRWIILRKLLWVKFEVEIVFSIILFKNAYFWVWLILVFHLETDLFRDFMTLQNLMPKLLVLSTVDLIVLCWRMKMSLYWCLSMNRHMAQGGSLKYRHTWSRTM